MRGVCAATLVNSRYTDITFHVRIFDWRCFVLLCVCVYIRWGGGGDTDKRTTAGGRYTVTSLARLLHKERERVEKAFAAAVGWVSINILIGFRLAK